MFDKTGYMTLIVGLLAGLLGGCGGSSKSNVDESGAGVEQTLTVPFVNTTMRYLSIYDSVNNIASIDRCLADPGSAVDSNQPYGNAFSYEYKMIESKTALYDFIHASYKTEVGFIVGKSQAAVDMSNEYKSEANSIYIAVKSAWDGPTFLVSNPKFKQTDVAAFKKDYPTYTQFVNACGDSFVGGVQVGIHFYGMIKYTFNSVSEKNTVHASLKTKTLTAKTKTELDNQIGFDTSTSTVTVIARTIGGTDDAAKIMDVKDVASFFTFLTSHTDSVMAAVKAGANGMKAPDPGLAYGYAVNAVAQNYKSILKSQYGLGDDYFSATLATQWLDKTIGAKFIAAKDAVASLKDIITYPSHYASLINPTTSLTVQEIKNFSEASDKFSRSVVGLEQLMQSCAEPDNPIFIEKIGTVSGRGYCKQLCKADGGTDCSQCDGLTMCALVLDKLLKLKEDDRSPFFTDSYIKISETDSNPNAITLPIGEIPGDCASRKALFPDMREGLFDVYYGKDISKKYSLYCDTSTPMKSYLMLPAKSVNTPTDNYSSTVYTGHVFGAIWTAFDGVRVVPVAEGLKVIRDDYAQARHFGATDTTNISFGEAHGDWVHNDWDSTHQGHANINLTGTPFALSNSVTWTPTGTQAEFSNWFPIDYKGEGRPNAAEKSWVISLDRKIVNVHSAGIAGINKPTGDLILKWTAP
jgi:hypothetical protein